MGKEGFRCDGAYGQVVMVLPEKNIVIACQSDVTGMQAEVDLIYELINNLYSDDNVSNLEDEINDFLNNYGIIHIRNIIKTDEEFVLIKYFIKKEMKK